MPHLACASCPPPSSPSSSPSCFSSERNGTLEIRILCPPRSSGGRKMPNPEEHVNRHEEKSRHICGLTRRARSWRGAAQTRRARCAHLRESLNCARQPADLHLHSYRILPLNIAHLRQEYMREGLSEAHALADPLAQFQ